MKNEAIQRLREPAAWILLASVAAKMLAAILSSLSPTTGITGRASSGSENFFSLVSSMSGYLGAVTLATILIAVVLMITAPEKSPRIFGIVLMSMILVGIAVFFGVISLITGFLEVGSGLGAGIGNLLGTAGELAVAGLVGFVLFKLFSDPTVVPRNAGAGQRSGQQQYGYGPQQGAPQQPFPQHTGGQQSFAPHTGAQQSFAPQPGPAGGAPSYEQTWPPAQPADPTQTGSGRQWPEGQDAYGRPSGAQASFSQPSQPSQPAQQPGYGQSYEQQPYEQQHQQSSAGYPAGQDPSYAAYQSGHEQQGYQDPPAAAPSGAQPSYDWSAPPQETRQPQQQSPYSQPSQQSQPTYGSPSGYDAPQAAQPSHGTGGQPSYGSAQDQPYGGSAQGYPTGGQASYGTAQEQHYGAAQGYPTGGQASYGAAPSSGYGYGTDPSAGAGYSGGTGAGTGGQQAYDEEATVVQQPGRTVGEQAAQEAVQYGWYPQAAPVEQPQQAPQHGDHRRDTPLNDFFAAEESGEEDSTTRVDPGYGNRFAPDGSYLSTPQETTSPYGENYGIDQQRQSGADRGDAPQGWYRDDDRR